MKKYAESAPIAINFTVDVDQGITIKPKLLTIQQGEHNARYFQVSLVHNDMPVNLANSEVHFLTQPHKSDEIPTTTNCEIYDAENGQIMVAVKDYMSNKSGIINGEFVRIGEDGSSLPFKNFTISVDGSIFVNDGLGQSEPLHSLVSALARVQRVEEYLEQEFMDVEAKYAGELSKTNAQLSTKASEQALAVERARIDNLTKLNEGSTTGDAELIDGRVGADGVVYPNLGDSIRTQINDSNNRTKRVMDLCTVGLNIEASERVGFLRYDGSYSSDSSLHCKTTSKIYCYEGWVFSYEGRGSALSASWIFYKGDRLIDYGQCYGKTQVTVPSGVDNIVFSSYNGIDKEVVLKVELLNPVFLNANNFIDNLANKINVSELDDEVKKAILSENHVVDLSEMTKIDSKYASIDGVVVSADNYACYEIDVKSGEVYSYSGSIIWQLAPYHLIDASGSVIVGGDLKNHNTVTLFNIDYLVIPNDVVKLRVCSGNTGGETTFSLSKKEISTPLTVQATKDIVENYIYDDLGGYTDITEQFSIITGYYVSSNGGLVPESNSQHTEFIDIQGLSTIYIDAHSQYATCTLAIYNHAKRNIGVKGHAGTVGETFWSKHQLVISDLLQEYPDARYIRVGTFLYKTNPLRIYEKKSNLRQIVNNLEERINIATQGLNVLCGKKYVACGDSFTEGDFSGYVDENGFSGKNSPKLYDSNRKMYKTYPWWIAERNNMKLINEAKCGTVITNAFGGQKNPFSIDRYLKVPKDADYITLMFGLNEIGLTTEQIGAKTDTTNTTLWGAYNIVFEHFLTNMPYAKIGVIIADAWMNTKYANAVKDICAYWGIPVLDLKFDTNIPMGIGGRPNGSSKAQQLRDLAFKVTPSNAHPNVEAHEYRSTTIENFLRNL